MKSPGSVELRAVANAAAKLLIMLPLEPDGQGGMRIGWDHSSRLTGPVTNLALALRSLGEAGVDFHPAIMSAIEQLTPIDSFTE